MVTSHLILTWTAYRKTHPCYQEGHENLNRDSRSHAKRSCTEDPTGAGMRSRALFMISNFYDTSPNRVSMHHDKTAIERESFRGREVNRTQWALGRYHGGFLLYCLQRMVETRTKETA
jgi:hypothetical protein